MLKTHKWGLPPWRVELPRLAAPPPAETAVAIVGAGLTGLSAAYHVRRAHPDWPVAVLEAATVGEGASGRSGGMLLEDTAAGPLAGFENCLQSAHELLARENIECGLVLHGCWEISHRRRMAHSPIHWDDGGQPLRVFQVVPGGLVDPGRMLAGLARAALNLGATVHEQCPVRALAFETPLRLETAAGSLVASRVLLATNAYSFDLSELHAVAEPLMVVAVATAPLEEPAIRELGLQERLPFYTEDIPYLWGRLTEKNELVLGGGILPAGDGGAGGASGAGGDRLFGVSVDSAAARQVFSGLERRIRRLHPALSGVEFTHRWTGPICFPHDRRPVFRRHSRSPRVLVAGGYSGHGLAQAIRLGARAAERLA